MPKGHGTVGGHRGLGAGAAAGLSAYARSMHNKLAKKPADQKHGMPDRGPNRQQTASAAPGRPKADSHSMSRHVREEGGVAAQVAASKGHNAQGHNAVAGAAHANAGHAQVTGTNQGGSGHVQFTANQGHTALGVQKLFTRSKAAAAGKGGGNGTGGGPQIGGPVPAKALQHSIDKPPASGHSLTSGHQFAGHSMGGLGAGAHTISGGMGTGVRKTFLTTAANLVSEDKKSIEGHTGIAGAAMDRERMSAHALAKQYGGAHKLGSLATARGGMSAPQRPTPRTPGEMGSLPSHSLPPPGGIHNHNQWLNTPGSDPGRYGRLSPGVGPRPSPTGRMTPSGAGSRENSPNKRKQEEMDGRSRGLHTLQGSPQGIMSHNLSRSSMGDRSRSQSVDRGEASKPPGRALPSVQPYQREVFMRDHSPGEVDHGVENSDEPMADEQSPKRSTVFMPVVGRSADLRILTNIAKDLHSQGHYVRMAVHEGAATDKIKKYGFEVVTLNDFLQASEGANSAASATRTNSSRWYDELSKKLLEAFNKPFEDGQKYHPSAIVTNMRHTFFLDLAEMTGAPLYLSDFLRGGTVEADFYNELKKNLANKIFGYLARCEFWLKIRW